MGDPRQRGTSSLFETVRPREIVLVFGVVGRKDGQIASTAAVIVRVRETASTPTTVLTGVGEDALRRSLGSVSLSTTINVTRTKVVLTAAPFYAVMTPGGVVGS